MSSPHHPLNMTSPDGSFGPVVARNSEVLGSNRGRVGCLSSGLCIYSVPNCSNACSAVYDPVHDKEPLKSSDKRGA